MEAEAQAGLGGGGAAQHAIWLDWTLHSSEQCKALARLLGAAENSCRTPALQLLAGRMERRLAEAETRGETAAVLASQASGVLSLL